MPALLRVETKAWDDDGGKMKVTFRDNFDFKHLKRGATVTAYAIRRAPVFAGGWAVLIQCSKKRKDWISIEWFANGKRGQVKK